VSENITVKLFMFYDLKYKIGVLKVYIITLALLTYQPGVVVHYKKKRRKM